MRIRNESVDCGGNLRAALLAFCLFALVSCGGGGSESPPATGSDPVTSPPAGPGTTPGTTPGAPPETLPPPASGALASGKFTLDEYNDFLSAEYYGVIEVEASPLAKRRLLDGSKPRRYADGRIIYRRPCGDRVTQIMLADVSLNSKELTPCSSNVPIFDTSAPVQFQQSALSADGTKVAAQAGYYNASVNAVVYGTVVIDVANQNVLARIGASWAPAWMPSGRLLVATSEGLMQLDENFANPTRLGDVKGPVDNPAINPGGTAIAFEHNQQIWGMNIDGSSTKALILGASRLKYPVWDPSGRLAIAYLSNTGNDDFEERIFVTDVATGENAAVVLDPVLPGIHTVNGPLSWTR